MPPFLLLTSPWLTSPPPEDIRNHPLIGATLLVARSTFHGTGLSPLPSPMTSVVGNPDFIPGLTSRRMRQYRLMDVWPQGVRPPRRQPFLAS